MPKQKKKLKQKLIIKKTTKTPLLVKLISILLITFPLQLLILVFTSLYLHFIAGYPIPENVFWGLNLLFYSFISIIIILTSIFLWKRNNLARIFAIIELLIISILNLVAEIRVFNSYSPLRMIPWLLFLLSAFYLLFSRKVKRAFS